MASDALGFAKAQAKQAAPKYVSSLKSNAGGLADVVGKGPDASYTAFQAQQRQQLAQKLVQAQKQPPSSANAGTPQRNTGATPPTPNAPATKAPSGLLGTLSTYAKAFITSPLSTVKDIATGQKINAVDNGALILKRAPLSYTAPIAKSQQGNLSPGTKGQLDHIVPLEAGGTNAKSNLKLIPKAADDANNSVENFLGAQLKANVINGQQAKQLALDYKSGKITDAQLYAKASPGGMSTGQSLAQKTSDTVKGALKPLGRPVVDVATGQGGKLVHDTAQLGADLTGSVANKTVAQAKSTISYLSHTATPQERQAILNNQTKTQQAIKAGKVSPQTIAIIKKGGQSPQGLIQTHQLIASGAPDKQIQAQIQKDQQQTSDQNKKMVGTAVALASYGIGGGEIASEVKGAAKATQILKSTAVTSGAGAAGTAGTTLANNPEASSKELTVSAVEGGAAGAALGGLGGAAGAAKGKLKSLVKPDLTAEKTAVFNQASEKIAVLNQEKEKLVALKAEHPGQPAVDKMIVQTNKKIAEVHAAGEKAQVETAKVAEKSKVNQIKASPTVSHITNEQGALDILKSGEIKTSSAPIEGFEGRKGVSVGTSDSARAYYHPDQNNAEFVIDHSKVKTGAEYSGDEANIPKNIPLDAVQEVKVGTPELAQKFEAKGIKTTVDPELNKTPATKEPFVSNRQQTEMRPNSQKPITTTPIKETPLESPKISTSKLAQGVETNAIKKGLTEGFGNKAEYVNVNIDQQTKHAAELLKQDPERAIRVAMGHEKPPGELLPESVFIAVENAATKTGNVDLIRRLATESHLTSEASGMGQRIRMLGERENTSPVAAIKKVQDARKAAAEKKLGKPIDKTISKEVQAIRDAKPRVTKMNWNQFVESIKC